MTGWIVRVVFESPGRVPQSMFRELLRCASLLDGVLHESLGFYPCLSRQFPVEHEGVYCIPQPRLGSEQVQSHHVHDGSTGRAFFTNGGIPRSSHPIRLALPANNPPGPSGVSVPASSGVELRPLLEGRSSSAGRGKTARALRGGGGKEGSQETGSGRGNLRHFRDGRGWRRAGDGRGEAHRRRRLVGGRHSTDQRRGETGHAKQCCTKAGQGR
eukprot:scaffold772_cov339-Pavlova_lutheri.AAC.12